MKNFCIFYTLHRQLDEIEYSSYFLNNSNFLKNNFDVILHCNNSERNISELKQKCKFKTATQIIVTTKNNGYSAGHIEAINDNFELLRSYKYCIHLHPDCYIVNDDHLKNALNDDFDYAVSKSFHVSRWCYNTDFFIFNPNINVFKDWKQTDIQVPEHYFYDVIQKHKNLKIKELNRYKSTNYQAGRIIDDFNIWHEHDNNKVVNFIKDNKNEI
jgi:hypothetical protein